MPLYIFLYMYICKAFVIVHLYGLKNLIFYLIILLPREVYVCVCVGKGGGVIFIFRSNFFCEEGGGVGVNIHLAFYFFLSEKIQNTEILKIKKKVS